MIIGANLRFGGSGGTTNGTRTFNCPASSSTEASLLYLIAVLGVVTNVAVMLLILGRATLRRFLNCCPCSTSCYYFFFLLLECICNNFVS